MIKMISWSSRCWICLGYVSPLWLWGLIHLWCIFWATWTDKSHFKSCVTLCRVRLGLVMAKRKKKKNSDSCDSYVIRKSTPPALHVKVIKSTTQPVKTAEWCLLQPCSSFFKVWDRDHTYMGISGNGVLNRKLPSPDERFIDNPHPYDAQNTLNEAEQLDFCSQKAKH